MEPYRVLHVLGELNRGGEETLIMNLYRKIDKEKVQFDFIIHTENEGEYTKEIIEKGGRLYSIPKYRIVNHFSYKKAWKKFFKEHAEYNIIHGHVRSTASIYLNIAKKFGLYTIAHSHSVSNGRGLTSLIKKILQYRIRFIADYFMGCSERANIWLFGKKIAKSNRCEVLHNGINIENFIFNNDTRKKIRKQLRIKEDEVLIGHVGRFIQPKNHIFILRLFEQLRINSKKYKLILIGNGKEKEKIKNELEKNKDIKDSVIILDSISNVYDYLNAMDIFILPSLYEGLGIVLIEAQISGLKCFASNKVPIEAKLMDDFEFIELDKSKWIKAIEEAKIIRKAADLNDACINYDINKVAKRLQDFYIHIEKSRQKSSV